MIKKWSSILVLVAIGTVWTSCDEPTNPGSAIPPASVPKEVVEKAESLSLINEKIIKQPDNLDLYMKRADFLVAEGEVQKALNDYFRILSADSSRGDAWAQRGSLLFENEDFAGAKDHFERCIENAPQNVDCKFRLAELELLLRNYDKAITLINDGLKIDKFRAEGYAMKGLLYMELGDSTLAMSSYQTAVEQDPKNYNYYIALGALNSESLNDLAIEYYNSALELSPNSVEALYGKAMYMQKTVDRDTLRFDEAFLLYDKIIELDPANSAAHFNKGYIFSELIGMPEEAVQHYTKAIEAYPGYYQALYNRGLCFERMGDVKTASNDFKKALLVNPQYTEAALSLQRVLGS